MRRLLILVVAASLAACARKSGPEPAAAAAAPARAGAATATAKAAGTVRGEVLEAMDSGGYTYMRLAAGGSEVWAAVNASPVKKGMTVTVENAMPMDGFESPTLHRKFDHIVFGTLAGSPSPSPGTGLQRSMAAQHATAAHGPEETGDVRVARAEGAEGKTIAEIYAGRAALKDKAVAVRGKVVKFLPGIMGRNWIHLRDGSGSADQKTNDLTVTTHATAAVGDVVIARGTVRLDRDLGAGYTYPVLIEDAKISK